MVIPHVNSVMRRFIGTLTLSLLCVLTLSACTRSDARIDGSSNEAFTASMEKVSKDLPEDQAASFRKALSILAIKHLDLQALLARKQQPGTPITNDKLRMALNGKTVPEVIRMGDEARGELQAKRAAAQQSVNQGRPSMLLPRAPMQPGALQPSSVPGQPHAPAPQS